ARQEVVENLYDPRAVGDEGGQFGWNVDHEVDGALAVDVGEGRGKPRRRLLHQRRHMLQLGPQLGDAGIDRRKVEDVVDEDAERDARGADVVGVAALLLV